MRVSKFFAAAGMAVALAASSAVAGPVTAVYDSIGPGSTGETFFTDVPDDVYGYDDLHVVGGGLLSSVRFAYGTEFFGGFAEGDGHVVLYLDDGATSPGALNTAEDTLLLTENVRGLSASTGPFGQVFYNVAEISFDNPSIVIPNNATIWAGVSFTRTLGGNLHAVYFAPISIGSSNHFTYPENGPPRDTIEFGLPENAGLGWELNVVPVPEPTTLSLIAIAGTAFIRRRR